MTSAGDKDRLKASVSQTAEDGEWDDFLISSPSGSFSQTGMWARVKEAEGWRTLRLILRGTAGIVSGVQILCKETRGMRIGYVVKGPVLAEDTRDSAAEIVSRLIRLAAERRIAILVLQPPDTGAEIPLAVASGPFLANHVATVISANLVLDLTQGWDNVERQMRSSTRREACRAPKMGVSVREGGAADIPVFHTLMEETCRRLNVPPNPGTVGAIQTMWETFGSRNGVRMTLAEHEGQVVAGLLGVVFGRGATMWKRGSTDGARSCHAVQALIHEFINWACRNGLETCDFAALARGTAEAMLNGRTPPEEARKTRDYLHLGFGGRPVLLPESRVLVPNPGLRAGYRLFSAFPSGRRFLQRLRAAV